MSETLTVTLSPATSQLVLARAAQTARPPEVVAEEAVRQSLESPHPHILIHQTAWGPQARIKGTRIAVSHIVGFIKLGETPETIIQSALPDLTLAQIHDTLSYYYDHQQEIEREWDEEQNTELWKQRLREQVKSDEDFLKITGQTKRA